MDCSVNSTIVGNIAFQVNASKCFLAGQFKTVDLYIDFLKTNRFIDFPILLEDIVHLWKVG